MVLSVQRGEKRVHELLDNDPERRIKTNCSLNGSVFEKVNNGPLTTATEIGFRKSTPG